MRCSEEDAGMRHGDSFNGFHLRTHLPSSRPLCGRSPLTIIPSDV